MVLLRALKVQEIHRKWRIWLAQRRECALVIVCVCVTVCLPFEGIHILHWRSSGFGFVSKFYGRFLRVEKFIRAGWQTTFKLQFKYWNKIKWFVNNYFLLFHLTTIHNLLCTKQNLQLFVSHEHSLVTKKFNSLRETTLIKVSDLSKKKLVSPLTQPLTCFCTSRVESKFIFPSQPAFWPARSSTMISFQRRKFIED